MRTKVFIQPGQLRWGRFGGSAGGVLGNLQPFGMGGGASGNVDFLQLPILFQDSFKNQPGGTDLVAGRDAVKWPVAAYLSGSAPAIQYDGAGIIRADVGVGPPAVRMYSPAITFNAAKRHYLKWEGLGINIFAGGQQASMSFGMECDASPALGLVNYAWNSGLAGNNTGANFTLNLNGALVTLTGAQYSAAAGATVFVTMDTWNGSSRVCKTYFNGVLIDSRTVNALPTGTQNRLRFVWSATQAVGSPNILAGKITFGGLSA